MSSIGSAMHWRAIATFAVSILGLIGAANADERERENPPNILLMTVDNLGYGDLGCYGSHTIKTPNMDQLAAQGVRCTDFYTASPTCTVSRACLLTGRVPQRHGLTRQLGGLEGNYGVGLRQSEALMPSFLKPLGYTTACFGKWNIGFAPGSRPTERGFDEFFGHASGNIDYYNHEYRGRLDMHRGTEPVKVEGYSTDLFADAACDFLRRHRKKRFFVYLPFNAPHFPSAGNKKPGQPNRWQAPDKYFKQYGLSPDEKDPLKRYRVVVTALDAAIGRVMKQLDSLGLKENTLVILYSDNGAFRLGRKGLDMGSNAPLRAGGVTLYEGGIRVACMVRWPGEITAGTVCRQPLLSCDLLPMFVRAGGGTLPKEIVFDGHDPTAALAGEEDSPHEALFFKYRGYQAVRRGQYKLIRAAENKPYRLFDLDDDLAETTDLAARKPKLAASLQARFDQWLKEILQSR